MRLPPVIELARPLNCLLAGAAVLIGEVITVGGLNISWQALTFAFLTAAFVSAGGNALNDYSDRETDRINRPGRPIPSGRITPPEALITAQLFMMSGIAFTAFLNPYCLLIAGLNSQLLILYAWKFKRWGLVGNLLIGYLVGSTFLFGGFAIASLGEIPAIPIELLTLVLMASLSTVGRELIKAIEDMKGDKKLGLRTFPIRYGAGKAAVLAVSFILAPIAISPLPYLLGSFGWQYLAIVMISIAAFLIAAMIISQSWKQEAAAKASLACKVGMALGLLAFIMGAICK